MHMYKTIKTKQKLDKPDVTFLHSTAQTIFQAVGKFNMFGMIHLNLK